MHNIIHTPGDLIVELICWSDLEKISTDQCKIHSLCKIRHTRNEKI